MENRTEQEHLNALVGRLQESQEAEAEEAQAELPEADAPAPVETPVEEAPIRPRSVAERFEAVETKLNSAAVQVREERRNFETGKKVMDEQKARFDADARGRVFQLALAEGDMRLLTETEESLQQKEDAEAQREQLIANIDPDDPMHPDKLAAENRRQLMEDLRGRAADIVIDGGRQALVSLAEELHVLAVDFQEAVIPGYIWFNNKFGASEDDIRAGYDTVKLSFPTETMAGAATAGVIQFMAAFLPARRVLTATKAMKEGLGVEIVAGMFADGFAFDPNDPNLVNMLDELEWLPEGASGEIIRFLETDPDDDEALNRVRNMITGATIAIGAEALTRVLTATLKAARNWRYSRRIQKVLDENVESGDDIYVSEIDDEADELLTERTERARELEKKARQADEAQADADRPNLDDPRETPRAEFEDAPVPERTRLKHEEVAPEVKRRLKIDDETMDTLLDAFARGDARTANGILSKAIRSSDLWDRLPEDDVGFSLVNAIADVLGEAFERQAKGPDKVQTHAMVKAMAKEIGLSEQEVFDLAETLSAKGGLAPRVLAAGVTVLDSVRHLKRKARAFSKSGSEADEIAYYIAIERNAALIGALQRSYTEIGRGLRGVQMWHRLWRDAEASLEALLTTMPRGRQMRKARDAVLKAKNIKGVRKAAERTTTEKVVAMVGESIYGNLLSSFRTLAIINPLSNMSSWAINNAALIGAWAAGASRNALRKTFGKEAVDAITMIELRQNFMGQLEGVMIGARLAVKTLRDGSPSFDTRSKVYNDLTEAIKFDPESASNPMTKAVLQMGNVYGTLARGPTAVLAAVDDVFKATAYHGRMRSLASREALKLMSKRTDLQGEAWAKEFDKMVNDLIEQGNREWEVDAMAWARRSTFQEKPMTDLGEKTLQLGQMTWFRWLIAPFISTPGNIVRQQLIDDNLILRPLANRLSPKFRKQWEEFTSADRAIEMSRAAVATGLVGLGMFGEHTGWIEGGYQRGDSRELEGKGRFTIRIPFTDYYIGFERIDKIGGYLGMGATLKQFWDEAMESEDPNMIETAVLGMLIYFQTTLKLLRDKSWTQSLDSTLTLFQHASTKSPSEALPYLQKYAGQQARKIIPFSSLVSNVAMTQDDTMRDAWGFWDQIQRGIPGLSDNLAVSRDYFGAPRERHFNEWSWLNPSNVHKHTDDPLRREAARLAFTYAEDDKTMYGVRLTPHQRSRWQELMGQKPRDEFDGLSMEDYLRRLVTSPEWEDFTENFHGFEGTKVSTIKNVRSAAKRVAMFDLWEEDPELKKQVILRIAATAKAKGADVEDMLAEAGLTLDDLMDVRKEQGLFD